MIFRGLPAGERTIKRTWQIYRPEKAHQPAPSNFGHWHRTHEWADRVSAWDNHFVKLADKATEKVFERELLLERERRSEILSAYHAILAQYFVWVNTTEKTPVKLRALATATAIYMEQSRTEFGDDPFAERAREDELESNLESVKAKIMSVLQAEDMKAEEQHNAEAKQLSDGQND